ncbi:hypothetical protein PG997_011684 [Apiospora hydei]|uniref:Uncharacterized protein n=1 Tax=Apiospora hydei TaxID=1337664 RepID=A0ABR1VMF5_9PEZI
MDVPFDISPEKRAGKLHFIYRQLFVKTQPLSQHDASLEGKRAVVTGSNCGLGLETARQLLQLGVSVVLAVRDQGKGEDARRQLCAGRPLLADRIEVWELDLSSYDSIASFVGRVRDSPAIVDIAVLNAGVFNCHESFASTGYEEDVQVNYLSNALLTLMLLPVLEQQRSVGRRSPARIVWVTSDTAAWASFQERASEPLLPAFRQPMPKWDMSDRYGTSKLLGQLFLTELARHTQSRKVMLLCANPGLCHGSGLGRQADGWLRLAYNAGTRLLGRSCDLGARPILHAAALLDEKAHGQYDAPIVYTPEGQSIAKRLHEETLSELSLVQNAHPEKTPADPAGSAVERVAD